MRVFISLMLFCLASEARYRAVPLMPPRDTANASPSVKSAKKKYLLPNETLAAVQFGLLSGSSKWLWGGKIEYRVPVLINSLRVKPGLGYYRTSEKEGAVSISQNVFDLNLGADWQFLRSRYFSSSVGLMNHLDLYFSRVSLYETSGTSPLGFRYRLAPQVALQFHLSPHLVIAVDGEYGAVMQTPTRTYGAVSAGIAFPF